MQRISLALVPMLILGMTGCERESRTAETAVAAEPSALPTTNDTADSSGISASFALSVEDRKTLTEFTELASTWIGKARLADLGRRNELVAEPLVNREITGADEVLFGKGLKVLQEINTRAMFQSAMNRRRQEMLKCHAIKQWLATSITDGLVIHDNVRKLLRDSQSVSIDEVKDVKRYLKSALEKISEGSTTIGDVSELAARLQNEIVTLGAMLLIEGQQDEVFAYLPPELLEEVGVSENAREREAYNFDQDFGASQGFDITLAVRRAEREEYRFRALTESYKSGVFSTWLHGQEHKGKTIEQCVKEKYNDMQDNMERDRNNNDKYQRRLRKFEFRSETEGFTDLTLEEIYSFEELLIQLESLGSAKLPANGYPIGKLAMMEDRLAEITKRQSTIWENAVNAGLDSISKKVEKNLGKSEMDYVQEAVAEAQKGESYLEMPHRVLELRLWDNDVHSGKWLAAALRAGRARYRPVWEVTCRLPEEELNEYKSERDHLVWDQVAAAEEVKNEELTKLEVESAKLLADGKNQEAAESLSKLSKISGWNPDLIFQRAECLLKMGDHEGSEKDLTALIRDGEKLPDALYLRAVCRYRMGHFKNALGDAWSLHVPEIAGEVSDNQQLLLAADMLACSSEEEIRNPVAAVGIMEKVCSEQGWGNSSSVECLARALAESGRSDDAEKILNKLRNPTASTAEVLKQIQQRKPFRMTF